MKTTIFSENQLKRYRNWVIILGVIFIALGIFSVIWAVTEEEYMMFFNIPALLILPIMQFQRIKRIRSISYDDEAVYYGSGVDGKIQKVSFNNIRSITIGRYDGWCKINLIEPVEGIRQIFFTPSVLFPFDFRKSGEKIYAMREKINEYVHTVDDESRSVDVYRVSTIY